MLMIDKPGIYRAEIESYELQEAKDTMESKAVWISMKFKIKQVLEESGWQKYDLGHQIYGNAWIINKRDGTVNTGSQERLMQATGWDGTFESILDQTWEPWPCQITVEEEFYKNRKLVVAWVNHWNSKGGDSRGMDLVGAQTIVERHSSALRASAAAILDKMKKDEEGTPGAVSPVDEVPF